MHDGAGRSAFIDWTLEIPKETLGCTSDGAQRDVEARPIPWRGGRHRLVQTDKSGSLHAGMGRCRRSVGGQLGTQIADSTSALIE
jgi:hypothetical protein